MTITLEQFNQLDHALLTRAIAEVVCGWDVQDVYVGCGDYECCDSNYTRPAVLSQSGKTVLAIQGEYESRRDANQDCYGQSFADRVFDPLRNLNDAVMVVGKLERGWVAWTHEMNRLCRGYNDFYQEEIKQYELANAPANLRMLALFNTVPEILTRYNELKGGV